MTTTASPTRHDPATSRGSRAAGPRRRPPASARRDRPARASKAAPVRPSDLPREHRIVHVFRTLGRGLVAEYDPA